MSNYKRLLLSFMKRYKNESWTGVIRGVKQRLMGNFYGNFREMIYSGKDINGIVKCKVNDYYMYLDVNDPGISRQLIRYGIREAEQGQFLKEYIRPGMVGIDLGANIGYFVIMESNIVGDRGKIIAIEPVKNNVDLLKNNLILNCINNVQIIKVAIGSENKKSKMLLANASNHGMLIGNNFDITENSIFDRVVSEIEVDTITLDSLIHENGINEVNFIRMDIEGMEFEIIEGMRNLLITSSKKMFIFVEVHVAHFAEPLYIVRVWLDKLYSFGFRPIAIAVYGHIERNIDINTFAEKLCFHKNACPHIVMKKITD